MFLNIETHTHMQGYESEESYGEGKSGVARVV